MTTTTLTSTTAVQQSATYEAPSAKLTTKINISKLSIVKAALVVGVVALATVNVFLALAAFVVSFAAIEVYAVWRDISFDDDKYQVSLEDIIHDLEC